MKCERCNLRLTAYLDGKLNARETRELSEHMANCRRCSEDLREFEQIRAILKGLPAPAPRPGFWDDSIRAVRMLAVQKRRMRRLDFRYASGLAAAIGIVAVLLSFPHGTDRVPLPLPETAINPASLVSLYARERGRSPLADVGKLRFASSQAEAADIEDNGRLDVQ